MISYSSNDKERTGPCADGANAAAEPTRARAMTGFIFEYGGGDKKTGKAKQKKEDEKQIIGQYHQQ